MFSALNYSSRFSTILSRSNYVPKFFFPRPSVAMHSSAILSIPTRQKLTSASSTEDNSGKNPLKRFLIDKIRTSGPISVAEYMQACVGSPVAGYYSKNDGEIFGARGDFVTSPEFTQMLGELLGVWVVNEVFKLSPSSGGDKISPGSGGDWQLVELGPGSGTLMNDVLGVLRKFRLTDAQFDVRLVETSRRLIGEQATILCGDDDGFLSPEPSVDVQRGEGESELSKVSLFGPRVHWHHNLDQMPHKFSVVLAHEFLDALPVHKFKRTDRGWREVVIGLDGQQENLIFNLASGVTVAQKLYLTKKLEESTKSDDLEISPLAAHICLSLADRINRSGGAVLIVDYGSADSDKKSGDTFRAYRNHKLVDPLQSPGRCDVTCDVDFGFLVDLLADKVALFGPLPQRNFLLNLGLKVRFEALQQAAKSDEERQYLQKSFDLLTDPLQMGQRFKAMALFPQSMREILTAAPPSGFCPLS